MSERVRLSSTGHGTEILFDAQVKRNAFDASMWDELALRLTTAAAMNPRFLVIRGAGPSFCAGGDLKSMKLELREPHGPESFRERIHGCLQQLYDFPAPTVASIRGGAIGGGLELALACDIRVASVSAKFRMPAARFGMVMGLSELRRLAEVVGWSWARVIVITGLEVDVELAARIGIVHYVTDDESLDSVAQDVLDQLDGMEPKAVRWSRNALKAIAAHAQLDELRGFEIECFQRPEFWDRLG